MGCNPRRGHELPELRVRTIDGDPDGHRQV
jgi:hypothetical protein